MPPLLFQLAAKKDLSTGQATELFHFLVDPQTMDGERIAILTALRDKGETPTEVAAFAKAMRAAAIDPGIEHTAPGGTILDVVGTGGDGASTINISTAAALLAAATTRGSVKVVKHGNRAISSKCGASDVLTALGVPAALGPEAARALLARTGFTYLHAPHYHASVAAVAAARKALGTRSIFNLLGPLTNPARPTNALIGAYSPHAAKLIAHATKELGYRSVTVVHTPTGSDTGLDEATTALPFSEWRVSSGRVTTLTSNALNHRFAAGTLDQIRGRDPAYNAQVIRDIFAGGHHPATDTVLLNTGLALVSCGWSGDVRGCARMARAAIDDGRATNILNELESFGREHSHAA
ncbi:MAG TPA: anthranilate phosphoribosyltransferase [Phycisphaerales bacterium]|nr:anthranilate phosphoribosyltransferase [Phycisphaerales bacterium]